MQFQPGSSDYFGNSGGQTVPPWLQGSLSRVGAASGMQQPPQQGGAGGYGGSTAPAAQGHLAGNSGMFSKWQDQQSDTEAPDWFQAWQNRQNRDQGGNGAPAAAPPAESPIMGPGINAPAAAAPEAAPPPWSGQAPTAGGNGAPSGVPNVEGGALPAEAAPPAAAPAAAPAYQPPVNQQAYQPGYGSAVSSGWYHDSDPSGGGQYAGEIGGKPIYYHYGNQSAEAQYNAQYPGSGLAAVAQAPVAAAPVVQPTPAPAASAAPVDNGSYGGYYDTHAGDNAYLPEALGGTMSPQAWQNNADQEDAGFGMYVPEALGGTMKRYAKGGRVRKFANGGGLSSAVDQIQSFGRGPDTMLAHISPDESAVIDYLQGGRKTNPATGLPEYSMFGDILKAVARAAAGIGGFMVGGPMGAAAGSAAATKLTGGSWNEALKAGAFSGIGGWATSGMGGAGWNPMTQSANAAAAHGLSSSVGNSLAAEGLKSSGLGAEFLKTAMSAPGAVAGLGALAGGAPQPKAPQAAPQQPWDGGGPNVHVKPQQREFQGYQGDPTKFAEPVNGGMAPGMGHKFYNPLLPNPIFEDEMPEVLGQVQGEGQPIAGLGYFAGGRVRGYADGGEIEGGIGDVNAERGRIENDILGQLTDMRHQMAETGREPPGMRELYRLLAKLKGDRFGLHKRDDALPFEAQYGDDLGTVQSNYNEFRTKHGMKEIPFGEERPWWKEKVPQMFYKTKDGKYMLDSLNEVFVNDAARQFGPAGYANGGRIRRFAMGGPTGPEMPQLGMAGADMPGQPGGAIQGPRMPGAGIGVGKPDDLALRRAALAGFNAFARGGRAPHEGPVRGPGTDTSDSIPAFLSNNEHVMTAKEVKSLGGGNAERGQRETYALRRAIKKHPAKVRAMVRGLGAL
jgi:hypothetical protein